MIEKIFVRAEREVAFESPDHLQPEGTKRDNSRNPWFNRKLYQLFGARTHGKTLRVLDIGCSGGGFVHDLLDDGHLAVSLEGSDYSKKMRRAEWALIPDFLFTADITKDVEVLMGTEVKKERLSFDVITSWEVIEHITQQDLPKVAENAKKHLASGGLWIMSVANYDYFVDGVNLHQTVKPKVWWQETFAALGLHHQEALIPFFGGQFIRGNRHETETEFHLILCAQPERAPQPPPLSLAEKFRDRWFGSGPQRSFAELVTGIPRG